MLDNVMLETSLILPLSTIRFGTCTVRRVGAYGMIGRSKEFMRIEVLAFAGSFSPCQAKKEPAKMERTMLPFVLSLSKGRLKLLYVDIHLQ